MKNGVAVRRYRFFVLVYDELLENEKRLSVRNSLLICLYYVNTLSGNNDPFTA